MTELEQAQAILTAEGYKHLPEPAMWLKTDEKGYITSIMDEHMQEEADEILLTLVREPPDPARYRQELERVVRRDKTHSVVVHRHMTDDTVVESMITADVAQVREAYLKAHAMWVEDTNQTAPIRADECFEAGVHIGADGMPSRVFRKDTKEGK